MHPYKNMPESAYWSRAISRVTPSEVDPVVCPPFFVNQQTKVATAGSCFAQHIARHLKSSGFNYYVAEESHPIIPEELLQEYNYGVFSARYGNIYTVRQLLQLFDRAFDFFQPQELYWKVSEDSWLDPFRPQIQPNGFSSQLELEWDRKQHLQSVRSMFENLDVFVFTLGLTECWISNYDGAVYPICPGVSGGSYSADKYHFKNFTVFEIVKDFQLFFKKLLTININAKIILTVSPVPLVATAEKNHVLNSTTYSKSVLRVAAEELSKGNENIVYFPSYEIITGNFSRGEYFSKDLRSITESGVNHVMRLFFKHYANVISEKKQPTILKESFDQQEYAAEMTELAKINCDEICYDDSLNVGTFHNK